MTNKVVTNPRINYLPALMFRHFQKCRYGPWYVVSSKKKKNNQNRRENIDKPEKMSSKKIKEKVRKTVDKKEICTALIGLRAFATLVSYSSPFLGIVTRPVTQLQPVNLRRTGSRRNCS